MNGKQLKNSILQWAIQGKLVPQDPNDEPASVLLERIRAEKERLIKAKKIKRDKNESVIYRGEDNAYYEKFADGTVKCIDDEITFEIPASWSWCRLHEVGITETGTTPPKTHPEYFGDFMPFIGPGNIQENKIVSITQGISKLGIDYCRVVPANTILQVCIGGSIGKAAIAGNPLTFNQQINSIYTYANICHRYIYYTILTDYFKQSMIDKSTGSATPIINRTKWEQILIPLPPKEEQERITIKIQELLPSIEKYSKAQESLDKLNAEIKERLKKSILQEAIQGKLVPQDPKDEPASVLLERIRAEKERLIKAKKIKRDKNESVIYKGDDNSYYEKFADGTENCIDDEIPFEIPANWSWCRLHEVGITETGTTPPKTHPEYFGDFMPFIGPGNIQENKIVSITQGISKLGIDYCRVVPANTILQVCIGGSIGKAAIAGNPLTFNQQINSIYTYANICHRYIYYTILTDYFKQSMIDKSTGSATPIINRTKWEQILIPLPPQIESTRICQKIEILLAKLQ